MTRNYWHLFILLILCNAGTAQKNMDVLWINAQDAYARSDYASAAESFTQIIATSPSNFAAMYNLGNCYLQDGELGNAILWYERARKLRPNDEDVLHNLAIANNRRSDPIVEIREFFAIRWIRKVSGLFSMATWAIAGILFFWTAVLYIAWCIRSGTWPEQWRFVLIPGICFILCLWFGVQRLSELRSTHTAIVVQEEFSVTVAPDSLSKVVAKIGPGEKVTILDSIDHHFKVRLANYEHGWVPMSGVIRI